MPGRGEPRKWCDGRQIGSCVGATGLGSGDTKSVAVSGGIALVCLLKCFVFRVRCEHLYAPELEVCDRIGKVLRAELRP